ncbi:MAG: 2-oxo acid dehydrogenase subunit E2 [Anaerolineae bacterium]|nr:2-oxo acid dehydrogenase subunit E2 [Anaerolineae bacterium]
MADIVTMPKLGFDMAEGTLVRWLKREGEAVAKGDVLAEIETDKATVEVESNFSGVMHRRLVEQNAVVPVGTPIAVIAAEGEDVPEDAIPVAGAAAPAKADAAAPAKAQQPAPQSQPAGASAAAELPQAGEVKASPLARRMAQERGIDLRLVHGSGPDGRVTRKDIDSYTPAAARAGSPPAFTPAAPAVIQPAPADQAIPQTKLRAVIARRMVESKQQVPHFYVTHAYRMEGVKALREQYNKILPEDQKLSINDFIVRAVALALREFPNLNAALGDGQVIRRGQVNVGVAVAVEGGLLTVVCRDADQKNLQQISGEVRQMAARARAGKVRPEDIEGSTFSISNLGMFDVENFIAIINPPESAILAVGSAAEVPVVADGQVKPGLVMKMTLSADHRVSDGAEAAQFMQVLEKYLEEPIRLVL